MRLTACHVPCLCTARASPTLAHLDVLEGSGEGNSEQGVRVVRKRSRRGIAAASKVPTLDPLSWSLRDGPAAFRSPPVVADSPPSGAPVRSGHHGRGSRCGHAGLRGLVVRAKSPRMAVLHRSVLAARAPKRNRSVESRTRRWCHAWPALSRRVRELAISLLGLLLLRTRPARTYAGTPRRSAGAEFGHLAATFQGGSDAIAAWLELRREMSNPRSRVLWATRWPRRAS
jgi:hypothetical protein